MSKRSPDKKGGERGCKFFIYLIGRVVTYVFLIYIPSQFHQELTSENLSVDGTITVKAYEIN